MKKTIIISAICLTFITTKANNIIFQTNNMLHSTHYMLHKSMVPADPRPRTIKQPNGKTLTFYIRGDERINWCETLDGYTLLNNEEGNLEYACIDENLNLVPSGILASNTEERDEEELNFLREIKPKLFFSKQQTDLMLGRCNNPTK